MSEKETRSYAYLLEDVMKENFKNAWKQEDLWKIAEQKDIIKYKMSDVKHWVYYPCWSKKNCFVSIIQVLSQPNNFKDHIERIKKAKLEYPLIVIEDSYDKYGVIFDGNHRFAKMILEKKRVVPIVFITKKDLEKLKIKL